MRVCCANLCVGVSEWSRCEQWQRLGEHECVIVFVIVNVIVIMQVNVVVIMQVNVIVNVNVNVIVNVNVNVNVNVM